MVLSEQFVRKRKGVFLTAAGCLQIPAGEGRARLVPLRFGTINQDVSIGENGVQGARVRLSRTTDSRKKSKKK